MTGIRRILEGQLADQLSRIMTDIDVLKAQERRASPLTPRQKLLSLLRKDVERTDCMHFTKEP